jgi:hypothetical protein
MPQLHLEYSMQFFVLLLHRVHSARQYYMMTHTTLSPIRQVVTCYSLSNSEVARKSIRNEETYMIRTKTIRSGDWRTVESFWNAKGTAFFRLPAGAKIKVRYGVGWLGFNRQEQTLNGTDFKKLSVGTGSVSYARMQVRVSQTTEVTYDVYPGGVAVVSPEVNF